MVKVTPIAASFDNQVRRLGFMAGQTEVSDDFDRMGEGEIDALSGGDA